MPPIGTLWGDIRQRQTKVILSVAALNGFELHRPAFSFFGKPTEFQEKFPYGKIPAFEGTDGFKLTEGDTIARYLIKIGTTARLLGSNLEESVVIDQWVHYAEYEISGPLFIIQSLVCGYGAPFTREALAEYTKQLVRGLEHLESHLASRSSAYIATDALSLADLVVAGTTNHASRLALGTAERAQYPAIFAHYEKVIADERIKQYFETERFIDVPITEPTEFVQKAFVGSDL